MNANEIVKKIKATATKVRLTDDTLGVDYERWIVEGDRPLAEEELLAYALERIEVAEQVAAEPNARHRGLVAIESGGRILRWAPGKVLDYCVWKPSFKGNESEYQAVVKDMARATQDWAAVCGIEFKHRSELDTKPNLQSGDVLIPVLRGVGGGNTIAMAFFPDSPIKEQIVWIFDGHFKGGGFDPVGVLRHELGHVLGFRHEHIRPEAPDYFGFESTEHTIDLSEYDPQSVMHYIGPGVGNPKLELTELDRQAACRVYGHPHTDFTFVG